MRRTEAYMFHPASEAEQLERILENCDLELFDEETAKVFAGAIERLFYSRSLRVGRAELPQASARSRLWELDGIVLREVEGKLRCNQQNIKNSTAYIMSVIFNAIGETHSDLMVDPYINSICAPPEMPGERG